jgi:branched-chain amino acid transport system ATP-binding protein
MSVHGRTRLGIAYVPDDKGIFGSLTTYENLQVASIGSKRADIEWVMELFPILRERKKQVAALLSGGEQQLLTIARALIVKPQLLVLDEVSEGLSPEAIATLLGTLRQLQQKGAAILLAEQNVRIGLSASDRVYMVLEGQIVFAGTVDEALREGAVDKYIRI